MTLAVRPSSLPLQGWFGSSHIGEDVDGFVGGGEEALELQRIFQELHQEWRAPASRQAISVEHEFAELVVIWRRDTQWTSSVEEMAMHPAYQRIIGMGSKALPFLLRELGETPDHWFWALKAITGCDPVPAKDRGRVERMTEAWLRWGRGRGYHG